MSSPTTKPTCLSQPMVKSVLVYRNGDPFFPGHRVVIHEKKVSNFEVFLKEVTGGVKAPFGAVRSIYTPRGGHRVHQLEELQSGEHYVAGGREAFKKLKKLKYLGEVIHHRLFLVSIEFYLNTTTRYITFLYSSSLIANGDLINPAVRLFIPRKTLNQWDHVLEMVTEKVTLRSGAVHRLYTLDGKLVQSGSDLENGQFYVAVGRDKFKKLPYGDLLFSKSTIRRPQGSKASSLPPVVGSRKSKGSVSSKCKNKRFLLLTLLNSNRWKVTVLWVSIKRVMIKPRATWWYVYHCLKNMELFTCQLDKRNIRKYCCPNGLFILYNISETQPETNCSFEISHTSGKLSL
uniref:Doublecortin domain-containing protein 2 n=1 Tax=Chelonoidis abingdonii TaxID=106734 RepID=A0A8C0H1F5_CHEAB